MLGRFVLPVEVLFDVFDASKLVAEARMVLLGVLLVKRAREALDLCRFLIRASGRPVNGTLVVVARAC
jgi:hypothetical protein